MLENETEWRGGKIKNEFEKISKEADCFLLWNEICVTSWLYRKLKHSLNINIKNK